MYAIVYFGAIRKRVRIFGNARSIDAVTYVRVDFLVGITISSKGSFFVRKELIPQKSYSMHVSHQKLSSCAAFRLP